MIEKIHQVPVLHVRGSYRSVGFSIGRSFKSLIHDFLSNWKYFSDVLLPSYETAFGHEVYTKSLQLCNTKFPQYVQELQGMAEGADVPFHHLFLLHIETVVSSVNAEGMSYDRTRGNKLTGCTAVLVNGSSPVLGHTEDAAPEMTNSFFIVCAQIINDEGEVLEDFSTLTYPGYLPGYTMGWNVHGMVYSVNTIYPSNTFPGRTPIHFSCRALMAAKSFEEIKAILLDKGTGLADGFSLNLILGSVPEPIVCNIEIGPSQDDGDESLLDIKFVGRGDSSANCNRYQRLKIDQQSGPSRQSGVRRYATLARLDKPVDVSSVKRILSDRSDKTFPIFRVSVPVDSVAHLADTESDKASTIAVGIFDLEKKIWEIYTTPPADSKPIVVLPLRF